MKVITKQTLYFFFPSLKFQNTFLGLFLPASVWNIGYLSIQKQVFCKKKTIYVIPWKINQFSSRGKSSEAFAKRGSARKVFIKIFQNSQENTSFRAPFLIKLQAIPE